MSEELSPGKSKDLGRLYRDGASVGRVHTATARLVPPYLKPTDFRVYVLDNKEWNAFACTNGMIVVHSALLSDMNDNEMAIVLGHELVHATHKHTRREFKRGMFMELMMFGITAGVETALDDSKKKTKATVEILSTLGLSIYFNDWDAKITIEEQQPQTRHRQAGTFAWSEAIVHTVQNVGKTDAHILRVELKF